MCAKVNVGTVYTIEHSNCIFLSFIWHFVWIWPPGTYVFWSLRIYDHAIRSLDTRTHRQLSYRDWEDLYRRLHEVPRVPDIKLQDDSYIRVISHSLSQFYYNSVCVSTPGLLPNVPSILFQHLFFHFTHCVIDPWNPTGKSISHRVDGQSKERPPLWTR